MRNPTLEHQLRQVVALPWSIIAGTLRAILGGRIRLAGELAKFAASEMRRQT